MAILFHSFTNSAVANDFNQKRDGKGVYNFIWENDVLDGTDRGYTNGVRLSYNSAEEESPKLFRKIAEFLPMLDGEGKKRVTAAIGQSMFTPTDINRADPDPNDRPYAGWLYSSIGMVSDVGKAFDNVMLTFGVVGPSSRAESLQKYIHKHITGSDNPQGWDQQLKDEPGIILTYERKWREAFKSKPLGVGFDVMPHIGVNLGNIETDALVGTTFRFGYNLPFDYGPPRIRPSLGGSDFFVPTAKVGGYLFSTFELRAIARNIFLDGNSFQSSRHVSKKNWLGSLQLGAAITYKDMRISLAQIFMTKEFKSQTGGDTAFSSLTISWRI